MIKMLFRYSFKNKVSLIALVIFTTLATTTFGTLVMLSQNLSKSYETLVEKGNLANGTVHELYSTTVANDDPSTAQDETLLTGDAAKAENQRQFEQKLSDLIGAENFRRFRSLDYNASTSGIIYKIIETDLEYTINKVVMYDGNENLDVKYNFTDIINEARWTLDTTKAIEARKLLLSIVSRAVFSDGEDGYSKKFNTFYNRVIEQNQDPKIVYNNAKTGIFAPQADKDIRSCGDVFLRWLSPEASNYLELRDKVYRLSCSIDDTTPVSMNFDNFSSYSIVVPSYVLENQNKEILPNSYYKKYVDFVNSDTYKQSEFVNWMKTVPSKYKLNVDNSEFLLLGSGISPDFMYPVYDFAHATPNPKTEVISYGNSGAYNLLYDANRSSPVDNYLVLKVDGLNQAMIDKINALSREYMAWPENINAAYFATDTSNILAPVGLRLNFLPQLVTMQITLSNMLSIFIFVLTGIIFVFSVRKFIYDNRSSLSVLRANGFKKRWIVWMMPMLAIIPGFGGGLLGYIISQFTQSAFLSLYGNFWLIPTATSIFNPLVFVVTLLVPFVVMSILAITFTYLTLRQNTKELMSESSRFKTTKVAKMMSGMMVKSSVMTRFKTSVAFSSIPKLIAISLLFTLISVATSFSGSLHNKFDYTKSATYDTKKYNYALDFITPTIQGGAYIGQSFKDAGKPIVNENNETLTFTSGEVDPNYKKIRGQGNTTTYLNSNLTINKNLSESIVAMDENTSLTNIGNYPMLHVPSSNDSNWQTDDINYLKNKVQTPFIIDAEIGLAGIMSSNPWNIARSLMPANAIAQANNTTIELWRKMVSDENAYFNEQNLEQYKSAFTATKYNELIKNFSGVPLWKIISSNPQYQGPYNFIEWVDESVAEAVADTDKLYLDNGNLEGSNFDPNKPMAGWYRVNRDKIATLTLKTEFLIVACMVYSLDDYQDYIYKVLYNIAVLEKDDETYTKVKSDMFVNGAPQEIEIMGIKPDTKFIDLINRNNEKVNSKLKLNNNVEEFNINHIHEVYDDNIMNDKTNYKIIINESAAYQYGLDIGSKIQIDPTEESTRYNPTNVLNNGSVIDLSSYNSKTYTFEVVDIIKTYQYPEFYVNQRIANHINNMDLAPILNKSYYNEYLHDDIKGKDIGIISYQIDPWNGIFSNDDVNKNLSVNTVIYSSSGIAPASDTIGYNKATYDLVKQAINAPTSDLTNTTKQSRYMSKLDIARALGYIDPITLDVTNETIAQFQSDYPTYTDEIGKEIIGLLIQQYSNSPFLSSVDNASYVLMYEQIFDNISVFVVDLLLLTLIIIFTISILSIIILSMDFIGSSMALCAILKALGIYDRTNAFSFLSMFFPAAIFGVLISIPLSILLNNGIIGFLYNFSSILLPLYYQWWMPFAALLIIAAIMAITIGFAIWKLKQQQLTKAISGF